MVKNFFDEQSNAIDKNSNMHPTTKERSKRDLAMFTGNAQETIACSPCPKCGGPRSRVGGVCTCPLCDI